MAADAGPTLAQQAGTFVAAASALQTATDAAKRSSAMQFLEACRKQPNAMMLGKSVLERSSDLAAQIQAAILIREVALLTWTAIPVGHRTTMRTWMLSHLVAKRPQRAVECMMVDGLAVMYKRGWLEEGDAAAEALFSQTGRLLSGDQQRQRLALSLLAAMLREMRGERRSKGVGMVLDFHVRCHTRFQSNGLKRTFELASGLLRRLAGSLATSPLSRDAEVRQQCVAAGSIPPRLQAQQRQAGEAAAFSMSTCELMSECLSVVEDCITWDFTGRRVRSRQSVSDSTSDGNGFLRLSLPDTWREVLARHDLTSCVTALYGYVRPHWRTELPRKVRSVLATLCGLVGSAIADPSAHERACVQCLLAMTQTPLLAFAERELGYSPLQAAVGILRGLDRRSGQAHAGSPAASAPDAVAVATATAAHARLLTAGGIDPTKEADLAEQLVSASDREQSDAALGLHRFLAAHGLRRTLTNQADPASVLRRLGAFSVAVVETAATAAEAARAAAALRLGAEQEWHEMRQRDMLEVADACLRAWSPVARETGLAASIAREAADGSGSRRPSPGAGGAMASGVALSITTPRGGRSSDVGPSALAGRPRSSSSSFDSEFAQVVARHAATIREVAGGVFEALVTRRLRIGSATILSGRDDDDQFEDASVLHDHLAAAGMLGRLAPVQSLTLLQGALAAAIQRQVGVRQRVSAASAAPTGTSGTAATAAGGAEAMATQQLSISHEELFWLLRFSGHLLCTDPGGEAPTIPPALLAASEAAAPTLAGVRPASGRVPRAGAGRDPVIALVRTVLQFFSSEMDLSAKPGGSLWQSPMVLESLLWFVHWWSRSYLLLDPALYRLEKPPPNLALEYGLPDSVMAACRLPGRMAAPKPKGPTYVELVITRAKEALALWAGEEDVRDAAILTLAGLLRTDRCAEAVVETAAWTGLVADVARAITGEQQAAQPQGATSCSLNGLPVPSQRDLMRVLITASRAYPDEGGARSAYVGRVAVAIGTRLGVVLGSSAFKTAPRSPAVAHEVERLFGLLEGLVTPDTTLRLGDHLSVTGKALQAVSTIVNAYQGEGPPVMAALAFVGKFLDSQIDSLTARAAPALYAAVEAVFQAYAQHVKGRAAQLEARAARGGAEAVRTALSAEDAIQACVEELCRILHTMARKDILDDQHEFGDEAASGEGADALQQAASQAVERTVLTGAQLLVPLMTRRLLQIPSLCAAYMQCIHHVVAFHTGLLASLPPAAFDHFAQAIVFGIQHASDHIVRDSLSALAQLLEYHIDSTLETPGDAAAGLRGHIAANPRTVVQFLPVVMGVAFKSSSSDMLVGAASQSLLCMAVCEQDAFRNMATQLIARQPSEDVRQKFRDLFARLLQSATPAVLHNPRQRRQTREQLLADVAAVAGLAQLK